MTDRSSRSGRDDAGSHSPLPAGTRVRDYLIEKVLGNGGFGITYLARHATLDRLVAVKEHFPREFALRTGITIRPNGADDEVYVWARRKFLDEARVLSRFDHPAIVKVLDVFEANGTAYMVQGFEAGTSFGAWLKDIGRAPTQAELDDILYPLLDALEVVHDEGLLHRDIAPDNIIIRNDGRPVLIDFGAARGYLGERTRTIAVVKPGYSPPEQYANDAKLQGPWTDIYSLGATLYLAVTGKTPQVAPQRGLDDENEMPTASRSAVQRYRRDFLDAIDASMAVRPALRPRSVAEWRDLFDGVAPAGAGTGGRAERAPAQRQAATPDFPWRTFIIAAAVMIALTLLGHFLLRSGNLRQSSLECADPGAAATAAGAGGPCWPHLAAYDAGSIARRD